MRIRMLGNGFGGAGCQDLTTLVATVRPEINEPIGCFDHIQMVFDDDDGVAPVSQLAQHVKQLLNVVNV